MNDSRKDDRLNVALIMRYREPTMLEPREGQCQNVSLSGMCIATPKPSPRGALIRFECISGGAADGIRGTARVVWQRSKGDQRGAPCMGVRFVRLEPGCREALEALIDQLGGERKPGGSGQPNAPGGGDPWQRGPGSDRPGKDTMIISPASGSGVTRQGMGKARSRSAHYPTLRGIGLPSSVPPRAGGRNSRRPALDVTLPGHATTSSTPFPTTPSSPPEAPGDGGVASNGKLRDRLDRTRRGMGPTSSSPPEPESQPDAAVSSTADTIVDDSAATTAAGHASPSDRPDREPGSDQPRQPGGVDDMNSSRTPGHPADPMSDSAGAASGDDPWPEYPGATATAEPLDDVTAARRRAARAAAMAVAPPELADPDSARRRNWLPWVVIGTGLLVSWIMIRAFGSVPAGVPVGTNVDGTEDSSQSAAEAPQATAPPAQTTATAPLAPPAQPSPLRTGGYVLEVASEPTGARISAADQVVLAPAALELAAVTGPITVKAELEGYEPSTVTIAPAEFTLQDGRHVGKTVVKLTAASKVPAKDEGSARPERSAKAPTPRRPRERPPSTAVPSAPPDTPQIAAPPVPIDPPTPTGGLATGRASGESAAPAPAPASAPSSAAPPETPASEPAAPSGGSSNALETALACLSRGDNLCVISTLEGRARTARELEVLIETHLALGNAADAERSMRRYLDRFPDSKSAPKYQRWLERRGGAAEP